MVGAYEVKHLFDAFYTTKSNGMGGVPGYSDKRRRCRTKPHIAAAIESTPEGLSVVDFSGLTRDQTAALSQVTVEDVAGGKRVQFKLHDKRAAAPARIAYPGARCG